MQSTLIVARKELIDHLRDSRALVSTGVYALMGPAVVALILVVSADAGGARLAEAVPIMAAVFTLMSAFSGASSVVIDMIAGERERRSLVPLLMSSASRLEIVAGKWLAAAVFAGCSAVVTLLAFAAAFSLSGVAALSPTVVGLIPSLLFLGLLAAAVEVLVSAQCRSAKEANTYLTVLVFAMMGVSLWIAFSPGAAGPWWLLTPIAGQQYLLQLGLATGELPLGESVVLGLVSTVVATALIVYTARLFERDAVVYGD